MVVGKFHVIGVAALPAKADSVLLAHADAELPSPIALQRFQVVAGRHTQIVERSGPMK
jgi:hypothetical protein